MFVDRTRLLSSNIKKLLRRGATDNLHKIINKTHTADLSGVFQFLLPSEQKAFFDLFDSVEKKAMLFSELEPEIVLSLTEAEPAEKVAEIFEWMPGDDVADLLGKIPDARAKSLLDLMTKKSSEEVEGLLGYDPKTASGIMVVDFIALKRPRQKRLLKLCRRNISVLKCRSICIWLTISAIFEVSYL